MSLKKVSQAANLSVFILSILLLLGLNNFPEIISTLNSTVTSIINSFSENEIEISNEKLFSIAIFILMIINIWKILVIKNSYFIFEEDRLVMYSGVINKDIDYLEYYRIKDYTVKQNIIDRIFNLHNIQIISTDRTHPNLHIKYLKNFNNTEEVLRNGIINATKSGRGREIDVV